MAIKEYSNGEVTILWQSEKCIHSGICVKTLPKVYTPQERPWIKPENATTQEIIDQVSKCPSGALSIKEPTANVTIETEDDGNKGRFMLFENGESAGEMTFTWAGADKFIIDHTSVEEAFGGKGYGTQLVMKGVEYAKEKGAKIIPLCPYAKKVFEKNEEIADMLFY